MKKRLRIAALVVLAVGGLVGLSRLFDFPAFEDRDADEINGLLDPSISKFYSYSLGGFLDEEFLWRVDGDQAAIESMLLRIGLERTDKIPREFWRLCPYYWPKGSFSGAVGYRSAFFDAASRGQDGMHFFAVHDPSNSRAYVWVKSNF
ncbi:hypothetical protein [Luteolibacter marinus]|uniref:hypothetical protein n=1 Tax=Luteolibacter marinus TaxID=2776705 RepID=UPI0018687CBB|nr:hypothetical protein [Luteolibacter marinus]